jgi:hypothetical protein
MHSETSSNLGWDLPGWHASLDMHFAIVSPSLCCPLHRAAKLVWHEGVGKHTSSCLSRLTSPVISQQNCSGQRGGAVSVGVRW